MTEKTAPGAKSDNPNVLSIKHMAFAVNDAKATLASYARFLMVPEDSAVHEYEKSRNRVAIFDLGGIEYQLCESMDEGGRFDAWIKERGGEGLHHICYEVDDIDKALDHAVASGATLRECKACQEDRVASASRGLRRLPGQRCGRNRDRVHAGLYPRRAGRIQRLSGDLR